MNTFGFDVNASVFFRLVHSDQLYSLWKTNLFTQNHLLPLGGGSNILFRSHYPGFVLKNSIQGLEVVKEDTEYVYVRVGGGEKWHNTVVSCVQNGWGGIENLSLIPGSVGAAPIQNIGAYGVEIENAFHSLEAFDLSAGKMVEISHGECGFGYRDSIFKRQARGKYFICFVTLKLRKKPEIHTGYGDIARTLDEWGIKSPGIADVSKAVIHIRQSKLPDPAEIGNCGSFFKNPVIPKSQFEGLKEQFPDMHSYSAGEDAIKVPAGWLIENCGWKGYRRGDAGVHNRQALVLVNYGTANGEEIYTLACEIQRSVAGKFGITLEMEVNIL